MYNLQNRPTKMLSFGENGRECNNVYLSVRSPRISQDHTAKIRQVKKQKTCSHIKQFKEYHETCQNFGHHLIKFGVVYVNFYQSSYNNFLLLSFPTNLFLLWKLLLLCFTNDDKAPQPLGWAVGNTALTFILECCCCFSALSLKIDLNCPTENKE